MVRALEQQAEVSLKFTVIGGEQDICICPPTPAFNMFHQTPNGLINEFVFNMSQSVDFANLVLGESVRDPSPRCFIVGDEISVIPFAPLRRFGIKNRFALRAIHWEPNRKIYIAPVHAV